MSEYAHAYPGHLRAATRCLTLLQNCCPVTYRDVAEVQDKIWASQNPESCESANYFLWTLDNRGMRTKSQHMSI